MQCKYSRDLIISQIKDRKTNSQISASLGCCDSIIKEIRRELGLEEIDYGTKAVMQFTKGRDFINAYDSAAAAARALSTPDHTLSASNITKCCKGHTKTAYGYLWQYANVFEFND